MDLETIRIQTLSVMQLDGLLKLCNCLKETGFDDKIQLMFIADKLSDLETVLHGLQYALGYQEALKRELELDASIRGKENQIESLKKEEESIRERIGHLQEVHVMTLRNLECFGTLRETTCMTSPLVRECIIEVTLRRLGTKPTRIKDGKVLQGR